MIYAPIPDKQCIICGLWYLATTENFRPRKYVRGLGLRGECRSCHNANGKDYHDRHPEQSKKYYQDNRDAIIARATQWIADNRDVFNERNRVALQKKRQSDPDATRAKGRVESARFKKDNPDKVRAWNSQRRARIAGLPATFTKTDWDHCREYWHSSCAYCGRQLSKLHQDHFIPSSRGGGYVPTNIVPACQSCNLQKKDRDPAIWLTDRFGPARARAIMARIAVYFDHVS